VSKRCLQQVSNRHSRQAILRLPRFKPDQVLLAHVNFGSVLNQEDSFIVGDELPENVQEGGLATPRSPSDEVVLATQDVVLKLVGEPTFQSASRHKIISIKVPGVELSDRQRDTAQAAWGDDGGNAALRRIAFCTLLQEPGELCPWRHLKRQTGNSDG